MPYDLLMFLHVGSMFFATALAVGPIALFVLILRSGDVALIRRAFPFAAPISRAGGICYGIGVIFGVATAINGGISLTSHWLLTAYGLVVVLVLVNLYADRWMKAVEDSARDSPAETAGPALGAWIASPRPIFSLAASAFVTLSIVFVMVVKPDLWG